MNKRRFSFAVLFFVFSSSIFSQNFSRVLELKTPRMNGDDIRGLQRQLFNLKFYQVGEADGYYGPLTESVIKDIQSFSGFESNGKVNRDLWNYIFNKNRETFIVNISTILTYNPMKLNKSRDLLYSETKGEAGGEAFIYSSSDGKPKIMEYYSANPNTATFITCYFISDSYYFAQYKFTFPSHDFRGQDSKEAIFLVDRRNIFEIKNGNQNRTDDDYRIIETVAEMLRKFYY